MKRVLTGMELGLFLIFASCAITMNDKDKEEESKFLDYFTINAEQSTTENYVFDQLANDDEGKEVAEVLDAAEECAKDIVTGDNINVDTALKYEKEAQLEVLLKVNGEYCKKIYELITTDSLTLLKTRDFGLMEFKSDEAAQQITIKDHMLGTGIMESTGVYLYDIVDVELKPTFPAEFKAGLISKKLATQDANGIVSFDDTKQCKELYDIKDTTPYILNCPVTDPYFCPISLDKPEQLIIVRNASDATFCFVRFERDTHTEMTLKNFLKEGTDKVLEILDIGKSHMDLKNPFDK